MGWTRSLSAADLFAAGGFGAVPSARSDCRDIWPGAGFSQLEL